MQHPLLLGAHMPISDGIDKAVDYGKSIGCTTIQIFTKSNRQWAARPLDHDQIDLFKEKIAQTHIIPFVHATYLINIASADKDIEKKSIDALATELSRCKQLGINYLILHPGSCRDANRQECVARVAHNLDKVFEMVPGNTNILLENMAGQGTVLGYQFQELKEIYDNVRHKSRVGFCLDTCHAHAAGYDLRTKSAYEDVMKAFDTILGLNNLYAIHLSDSKKELGSKVDRHEEIGKGAIGIDGFSYIMNDPRLAKVPKILETPRDTLDDYKKNMEILRKVSGK